MPSNYPSNTIGEKAMIENTLLWKFIVETGGIGLFFLCLVAPIFLGLIAFAVLNWKGGKTA
jgi:hypothetical protein